VDAVGTGGSRAKTFNVSTAAAFVIAGAGIPVAKHGNRAASSRSGSADVLGELGVRVDIEPELAEKCLNELGICFMFAPKFHSLSPQLANARRRLAEPTIFNCLGPLCNPAGSLCQVIGAWDREVAEKMANVLARFGTKRSWIVNGENGLDEISLSGRTFVYEVCCEKIKRIELFPADFGLPETPTDGVPRTTTSTESAVIIREILNNKNSRGSAKDLVLLNAASAIFVAGGAGSLEDAVVKADESIRSGKASAKLHSLASATNQ